ncbi:metaxin-2-like [Oppia nitens]|uniref:metaxin-2-like n=1 Tax=Oppia nitens TaxID=1686743 RepID=UPI0023DB2D30|nr:metaxin-2-like [Oppia nitens]
MPNVLLTESIAVELGGAEPWPEDVRLFQPFDAEQILLPEVATVRACQAFLRMCGLPFTIDQRANAEQMSPSGGLPFIKCGQFVIAELDPIVAFCNTKGHTLSSHLDMSQRADMRAYMSLVMNVLYSAELYLMWSHEWTYGAVTYPRYSFATPFPLNKILCWKKRRSVLTKLESINWSDKKLDDVYDEVDSCCQALAERLGHQLYFFGDKKTELDALVYGHISAIMITPLADYRLRILYKNIRHLLNTFGA